MRVKRQLPSFAGKNILVIGEVVLDKYIWGTVERISPEAPIPVVKIRQREARPGNAAFVSAILRALGAGVALMSVAGADVEGRTLRQMLRNLDIGDDDVVEDPGRPTIVKERLLGSVQSAMRGTQQLLRLDEEDPRPLDAHVEESLLRTLAFRIPSSDGILVSDINKGLLTPQVLQALVDGASRRGVPIIIDPRLAADLSIYRGATALTPNRYEAERATGVCLTDRQSWETACRALVRDLDLELCLVTLDREGMLLCERNGEFVHLPTKPREVYDVTGAGDVAHSVFGLCVVAGLTAADAGTIANVAAGLEVGKQGASVISAEELNAALIGERDQAASKILLLEDLRDQLARHRDAGESVCFTHGRFNALHSDDVRMLEFARSQGNVLVVGVSGDNTTCNGREEAGAVCRAVDRARLVAAVEAVDYVTIYDDASAADLVRIVRPQIVVKRMVRRNEPADGGAAVDGYASKAVTLQWSSQDANYYKGVRWGVRNV
jgi:D-beta-D-heptose 7-phosphate kinase/D-beta-D-heptose 1-phosphate adenosyltransferase